MFGWRRRGDKTGVKVLSCSEETLGRNSSPWHFPKVRGREKKSQITRKPLSEPLQWKEKTGINSPVTKVVFDVILNDPAFCLFSSEHDLLQPLNNEVVGDSILKLPKPLGPMKIWNLSTSIPHPTLYNKPCQRKSSRCGRFCILLHHVPEIKIGKTRSMERRQAYRLHTMVPLSSFPPPVQGSRSIWQSGISLQSCSCCSIGVQRWPHMFLLSRELKSPQIRKVNKLFQYLQNEVLIQTLSNLFLFYFTW